LRDFIDAMVMVDGLKRVSKKLTRDGLVRGIESLREIDLGLGPNSN